MRRTSLLLASFLVVPSIAAAQGADDCASAQPISGQGVFAFDNSAATTDGAPDSVCGANQQIENDVWFAWTATDNGDHVLTTCGQTSIDSKIAVYDPPCGGFATACNDDACGLQSSLSFIAIQGNTYLFRIGNFPGSTPGTGTFRITFDGPILNPNNGHYYELVDDQLSWPDAKLAAEQRMWQGMPGHLVTIEDQTELDWILQNIPLGRPWIGLSQNLNSPSYSEPDGGWEWVTGEPLVFTNWASGEPNNTSANGRNEDHCEMFANGEWNDAERMHANTTHYLVEWDTALGSNYCTAVPNSTGATGVMSASGTAAVAANDFHLEASDLPPNSFGFFLNSMTPGFQMNPGGSTGNICLAGAVGRFQLQVQDSGANGFITIQADLNAFPTPTGPVAVQSGETWYFQLWHRDTDPMGNPTSNFTDGLEVAFN